MNPPKMFPALCTTVIVGPLLSHLEWNVAAAKPSREARNNKRHSPTRPSGSHNGTLQTDHLYVKPTDKHPAIHLTLKNRTLSAWHYY